MNNPLAWALGILILVVVALLVTGCGYSEEQKARGEHCQNQTGDFYRDIKAQLHDPSSFKPEFGSLVIDQAKSGMRWGQFYEYHPVRINFQAKNGFGAYSQHIAHGVLDVETCRMRLIQIQIR